MSGPLIRLTGIGKRYGALEALRGVDLEADAGEVACVLGDNGAGKSTLIKIIAGLHPHDAGTLEVDGQAVRYGSPREAIARGVATVFQDLALAPLMPVWANLFLGQELETGWGPFRRMDVGRMREVTRAALADLGTDLPDVDRPVADLSGGQRQCVAIARAIHFGARALVLDEPTAALGVRQAAMVLRQVAAARSRGLAVVLVTHNPHHAYAVGDRFLLLQRGEGRGAFRRSETTVEGLTREMAGGGELTALTDELRKATP